MNKIALAILVSALIWLPTGVRAEGGEITSFHETVDLSAQGAAHVETEIALEDFTGDTLDLPQNLGKTLEHLTASVNGTPVTAEATQVEDSRVIRLHFDAPLPQEATLHLSFDVPSFVDWAAAAKSGKERGRYALAYTFYNPTFRTLSHYGCDLILPPGYIVDYVSGSVPAFSAKKLPYPYAFDKMGERVVVHLISKAVKPGRYAQIKFYARQSGGASALIVGVGILIAAAALYFGRDLLKPPTD